MGTKNESNSLRRWQQKLHSQQAEEGHVSNERSVIKTIEIGESSRSKQFGFHIECVVQRINAEVNLISSSIRSYFLRKYVLSRLK